MEQNKTFVDVTLVISPFFWLFLIINNSFYWVDVDALNIASVSVSPGEAALRCGLGEKEDQLGSFTKKAMHIQLDR